MDFKIVSMRPAMYLLSNTKQKTHRQGTDGYVRTNTASGKLEREHEEAGVGVCGGCSLVVAAVCRLTQPETASAAACSNEPLPALDEY